MTNKETESPAISKGCIIEVDSVAFAGIQSAFEVVRSSLAEIGVEIDEGLFVRYILGVPLETGLNRLLATFGQNSSADLVKSIREGIDKALLGAEFSAESPLAKFITTIADKGVVTGILTRIPWNPANDKFSVLLANPNVALLSETSGSIVGGFGRETWLRVAEKLQLVDRLCVAVVASASSGRSALAAGLSVVACANEMTDWQDFTGANAFFDKFDADAASKAVFEAIRID